MKKIIAAAAGLMLVGSAMVTTAQAVENKFGGYWRTRFFTFIDTDPNARGEFGSYSAVDTRTRLYYTAIFNENFKFVNKFEFDATWGEDAGYGDFGADGVSVEVKNSYADFNLGAAKFKVGVQGFAISRGFVFDNDAAGVTAVFDAGGMKLPFVWLKGNESEVSAIDEYDIYGVLPTIAVGEGTTVTPFLVYAKQEGLDTNVYFAGVDVDAKMDAASFWGTAIYQFGERTDMDVSSFLVAAGASAGPVHGQAFYATGDDDPTDGDIENFLNSGGASYYWAEILGAGTFDQGAGTPGGTPNDVIQNVWAANVGFTVKPMDKLTLGADLWYAEQAEGEDLGVEIDVKATYALMDNLKLDLVAAYLAAGDAVNNGDEDPITLGARLSLSF